MEYLQTPEELDAYKQFSMCINCMLCYAACPVYGLDPEFIGPAAIALAERYDLDSRDQGNAQRLDVLIEHEGVWGCTFVGECTRVCPKHVDPAAAIQRYKLKAALADGEGLPAPAGRAMTLRGTETGLRLYRPRVSTWWWTRKRTYFVFVMRELSSIFVAWFVVYLLLFVYAVGRGEAAYQRFLDWASSPWVTVAERRRAGLRAAAHGDLVRPHPAGDGGAGAGQKVPAFHIIAGQYTGLVVVSGFVLWLVTR